MERLKKGKIDTHLSFLNNPNRLKLLKWVSILLQTLKKTLSLPLILSQLSYASVGWASTHVYNKSITTPIRITCAPLKYNTYHAWAKAHPTRQPHKTTQSNGRNSPNPAPPPRELVLRILWMRPMVATISILSNLVIMGGTVRIPNNP